MATRRFRVKFRRADDQERTAVVLAGDEDEARRLVGRMFTELADAPGPENWAEVTSCEMVPDEGRQAS